jgi:hypothetical protein
MMCGCDGGWYDGDGSLKSVFARIHAVNHRIRPHFDGKFRSPVTKVYGGGQGPRIAAVGRPPWFLQTMLTRGGELSY